MFVVLVLRFDLLFNVESRLLKVSDGGTLPLPLEARSAWREKDFEVVTSLVFFPQVFHREGQKPVQRRYNLLEVVFHSLR